MDSDRVEVIVVVTERVRDEVTVLVCELLTVEVNELLGDDVTVVLAVDTSHSENNPAV